MVFFDGVNCFIIPNILGKSKAELFVSKLRDFGGGGEIYNTKNKERTDLSTFSHIVVDASLTSLQLRSIIGKPLNTVRKDVRVVSAKWLTRCLETKALQDCDLYTKKELITDQRQEDTLPAVEERPFLDFPNYAGELGKATTGTDRLRPSDCTEEGPSSKLPKYSQTVAEELQATSCKDKCALVEETAPTSLDKSKFICMTSSRAGAEQTTPVGRDFNDAIINKLQEMAEAYKSTKDKWRVFSYQKAIIALKSATQPIDSVEKALKLPNIGKSLAEKIAEIADSGSLEKLEVLQSSETLQAVQLFMRIWGVGAETANLWANQGLRTLDDVREKAVLTANQKIGLKYFYELDERMQREEVSQIEKVVESAVKSIDSDLEMVTCGSYRRGKATCGDVDILITHADGRSHVGVFDKLLSTLRQQEFLTDDLTFYPNMKGGMAKYLGVCKLPGPESKHRRIDIIVTPFNQYGCCLVYFTGSAHFNRSMRLMADKMGMSLTEHALYKDVIRGPNKEIIHHGVEVPTPTERSVFHHLGIPYREPQDRDHE